MSVRLLEITKLLAPLLGIILGAIAPQLINRLLPADAIRLNKEGISTVAGIGGGLGAVLVYWTYTGNINYWWGSAGFFSAVCVCWVYIHYFAYPFKKFRVTCLKDVDSNVIDGEENGMGLTANKWKGGYDKEKKRWILREGWGVWGPYISLKKGKYKATFRIKAAGLDWDQENYLCEIDIAASYRNRENKDILGDKKLALHTLTTKDFKKANKYNKFSLVFCIYHGEDNIEFRIRPRHSQHIITFDYVKLSRVWLVL